MFGGHTARTGSALELLQKHLLPRVSVQVVRDAPKLSALPLGKFLFSRSSSAGQAAGEGRAGEGGPPLGRRRDRAGPADPCQQPRAGTSAPVPCLLRCTASTQLTTTHEGLLICMLLKSLMGKIKKKILHPPREKITTSPISDFYTMHIVL